MSLDENLKDIFEYIFVRKGRSRPKTVSEAILAAYLISTKASNKQNNDANRGTKASQAFKNLAKLSIIRRILNNIKKKMNAVDIKNVIDNFKKLIKIKEVEKYIKNESVTKQSVFSKPSDLQCNDELKTNIKDEFNRYANKHKNTIPDNILNNIQDSARKETVESKQKIRGYENTARKTIENKLIEICDSIYNKNGMFGGNRIVLNRNIDYVDCIYISTENKTVHRIIIGKKGAFADKKFKTLESKDESLNKQLNEIMKSNDGVYNFLKIAEGKTEEKYEYARDDKSQKKKFSYRYRVYCNTANEGFSSGLTNLELAPKILDKLGYKIKYKGDKNQEPNYGALGKGSFNAAYEENNSDKKITRVIKICISSYEVVTKERKGNKKGCKAFEDIKSLDSSGKNIRELFYQNEDLVLSKNKEFGKVSTLIDEPTDLWYCISTSKFRSDGDAEKFDKEHIEKFKKSETEKLIELQAFTKGILNGLVRMHKRGIVHLDVKPANTLKKSLKSTSAPYYKYSLTDFGTAVDIGKRIKENSSNKLTWETLLDGVGGVGSEGYFRGMPEVKELKEIEEVQPELIYKLDSFIVGTSMCMFYKLYLDGKKSKELTNNSGIFKDKFAMAYSLDKGQNSEYISWLPDGNAKDLAKKLMTLDIKERLSCEQALEHPFIKKV